MCLNLRLGLCTENSRANEEFSQRSSLPDCQGRGAWVTESVRRGIWVIRASSVSGRGKVPVPPRVTAPGWPQRSLWTPRVTSALPIAHLTSCADPGGLHTWFLLHGLSRCCHSLPAVCWVAELSFIPPDTAAPFRPLWAPRVSLSSLKLDKLLVFQSHKKVGALWRESGLSWKDYLPEGEDVHTFLTEQVSSDHLLDHPVCSSSSVPFLCAVGMGAEVSGRWFQHHLLKHREDKPVPAAPRHTSPVTWLPLGDLFLQLEKKHSIMNFGARTDNLQKGHSKW